MTRRRVDILPTGEEQPRLPGAEYVRDIEIAQPPLVARRADPDDFTLTAEQTEPGQPAIDFRTDAATDAAEEERS